MTDADIVMCAFTYTGENSNDQFACYDFYSSGEGTPDLDANDNIYDVSTTAVFSNPDGT